jgi:ABC-type branched-subunit amino acid transport system permease subunit
VTPAALPKEAQASPVPRMEGTAGRSMWTGVLRGPLVIAVLFAVVLAFGSSFDIYVAGSIAIYGLASAGQGWLMGRAGQVSLGGGALFAVGAFAAAFTTQIHSLAAFPLPLIAAGLVGAVTGAIVAVPGLRFRGVYLLLATLALLYVVQFVGERLQQGNANYLAGITMNPGPGSSLMNAGRAASVTAAVVLVIGLVVIERLYRTQAGREWASVKENEIASAAMGIRVRRRKIQAFVGSSVVTAVAGGLFAYYIGLVSYTAFDLNLTLQHLLLKACLIPALWPAARALARAYRGPADPALAVRHTGAIMLARLWGKSPVEYLTAEPDRVAAAAIGGQALHGGYGSLTELLDDLPAEAP